MELLEILKGQWQNIIICWAGGEVFKQLIDLIFANSKKLKSKANKYSVVVAYMISIAIAFTLYKANSLTVNDFLYIGIGALLIQSGIIGIKTPLKQGAQKKASE